jgi:hypothetical protein
MLLSAGLASPLGGCKEKDPASQPAVVTTKSKPLESQQAPNSAEKYDGDVTPDAVRFAKGILFKPDMDAPADDARMAPLIIREIRANPGASVGEFFGSIDGDESNRSDIDSSGPPVYLFEDMVQIAGVTYRRTAHVWSYARSPSDPTALGCVQIIMNQDSMPVLWQVLDTQDAKADSVYVAQSVERAAKRQHGQPLALRRFAVESSLESAPVRVVRLIDDGPEPMGPMVYVTDAPHRIAALACRCMDSQVDAIEDARFYRLVRPASGNGETGSIAEQVQNFLESRGIDFDDRLDAFLSRELDKYLRLPASL